MTDYFYLLIMAAAEKKEVQGLNFEELVDRFARLRSRSYPWLHKCVLFSCLYHTVYTWSLLVVN